MKPVDYVILALTAGTGYFLYRAWRETQPRLLRVQAGGAVDQGAGFGGMDFFGILAKAQAGAAGIAQGRGVLPAGFVWDETNGAYVRRNGDGETVEIYS